jgi:hypothetical protein
MMRLLNEFCAQQQEHRSAVLVESIHALRAEASTGEAHAVRTR